MYRYWFETLSSRQKSGLVLFLVGLIFSSAAFSIKGYQEWQQNVLSFSQSPRPLRRVEEQDLPGRILIPTVKIELPVLPAKVVDNDWETFADSASYLLGSGIPGREGNTILYAHNKNRLFGPIRWLKKDDQITLANKKGEEFIYKVVETKIVSPETVEVLSATQDATLTLYTCTGFLDRDRFIVVAKLQAK